MTEMCVTSFPTVGKPESSWTIDQLGQFAKQNDKRCRQLGRKLAVHRYREGQALTLAHKKVPYGKWGWFLKKYRISKSSDNRARQLFAKVGSEEELRSLEITEAYERHGITKQRKAKGSYESLIKSLPAPEAGDEVLPDDLPSVLAACEQATDEMHALRGPAASEEDRARHAVVLRRWLRLIEKRDQITARQERQASLAAAEARRLEKIEAAEPEAAKLFVLLEDACGLMQQVYAMARAVDPSVMQRPQFGPLTKRFVELVEDVAEQLKAV